jgi:iron complex outermembrane receptor protein
VNQKQITMGAISLVMSGMFINNGSAAETEAPVAPVVSQSAKPAEPAEQTTQNLGDVVVSAEKDRPVQQRTELGMLTKETPLAGTIVGREELEVIRSVTALEEVLRRVPGISLLRNLRFPDGGKFWTDNRTDGLKARNTGNTSFIDMSNTGDIERIEIIRGPGSVLNGSNAVGGTINVISRNPPKKLENEVSLEVMGDGGYRAGVTSGAQISPNLGYFLNANRQDTTGWRDHTEETKDSFSTKWMVNPEDVARLSVRLEYLHDDYQEAGTLNEKQFNENWRQAQPGTYLRTDVTYITPSVQYRRLFGEVGELNVYGLWRLTDQAQRGTGSGGGGLASLSDITTNDYSIQTLYKHSFDFAKTAITGGLDNYFSDSTTKSYTDNSPNSFEFNRGTMTGESVAKQKHNSPFLQLEFSPLKPLRFSFGARYDNIEYIIDDKLNDKKDGNKKYSELVKKAGATYNLNENNLIWVNIAEGFLAPSVSTLLGSNTTTPATHAAAVATKYVPTNMDLEPETSLTEEIGIRGNFGSGFSYDVDYYHTKFKNLVVSQMCDATELCYTKNVTAGSASAHGVESSLGYVFNRYLESALSYTYSQFQYDTWVTTTTDYSGKDRVANPTNHYNLRVTVKPVTGLKAEFEMDHIDSYYINSNNVDTYQRLVLCNLRVNYNYKNWNFWGNALNLFDVKYDVRVSATDAGVRSYNAGYAPLMLRAGIAYRF